MNHAHIAGFLSTWDGAMVVDHINLLSGVYLNVCSNTKIQRLLSSAKTYRQGNGPPIATAVSLRVTGLVGED
jgi:hypothetical protein